MVFEDNPYRPSAFAGNKSPDTGLNVLIGGSLVALICLLVVCYLMIGVIPDLKDQLTERALGLPVDLETAIDIADVFVRYWLVLLVAIASALVLMGCMPEKKRRLVSRTFGGLLAVFSLGYTAWLLVSSIAATP